MRETKCEIEKNQKKDRERKEARRNVGFSFLFLLISIPFPSAPHEVSHSEARLSVYQSAGRLVRECGQCTKLRRINVSVSEPLSFVFHATAQAEMCARVVKDCFCKY